MGRILGKQNCTEVELKCKPVEKSAASLLFALQENKLIFVSCIDRVEGNTGRTEM